MLAIGALLGMWLGNLSTYLNFKNLLNLIKISITSNHIQPENHCRLTQKSSFLVRHKSDALIFTFFLLFQSLFRMFNASAQNHNQQAKFHVFICLHYVRYNRKLTADKWDFVNGKRKKNERENCEWSKKA